MKYLNIQKLNLDTTKKKDFGYWGTSKRFKIDIHSIGKRYLLISENRGSKLLLLSSEDKINILYNYKTKRGEKKSKIVLNYDIVNIKGWKALGNRLDNKSRMSAFSFQPLDNEIIKPSKG